MKIESKKRIIIWLLSLFLTIGFFFLFVSLLNQGARRADIQRINEGWTLNFRGQTFDNVNTEEFAFSSLKKGEVVELSNTIYEGDNKRQVLVITTYLSTVDVWIEDDLIYTYGHEYVDAGKTIGSGRHCVELPDDYQGKTISIRLVPGERDAFTSIGDVIYGDDTEILYQYMKENLLAIIICVFLIVLGIVTTVIAVVSTIYGNTYVRFIPITLFSFVIGLYGLCSVKFFEVCGISMAGNTTAEYITLYMVPGLVALIFATMRKNVPKIQRLIYITSVVFVAFSIVADWLHFTDVLHFPAMLRTFHICGVLVLIEGFFIVIYNWKNSIKANMFISIGFFVLCIAAVMDLVRFNLLKYYFRNTDIIQFSLLPVGALIFIVLLLISSMMSVYQREMEVTERSILAKLAYTDALCQVNNRAKFQQVLERYEFDKSNFAIVAYDVNGLKPINDQRGHDMGDVLLQEVAHILRDAFAEIGDVFRVGGDEFAVIVDESKYDMIDIAVKRVKTLETTRSAEVDLNISASYGVAKTNESEDYDIKLVMKKADQRMYAMKQAYHNV